MTENTIQDWLSDYLSLSSVEIHSYATTLEHNEEVVNALYSVLEERNKYSSLIDPVCNQLFGYYRSREVELQRFTLQFLPTLIYIYLNSVAHGDKKSCRSVETLLIGVYNLEVVDESGQPVVISFRLPSLAQASIYHEPSSLAHASFTGNALRRLEECNNKLVTWGPLQQIETLNAQNRLRVMTALLFVFNRHIGAINKPALRVLCKTSAQLVTQGFHKPGHHQRSSFGSDYVPKLLPRIPVTSQFLLELVSGLYYAVYNDYGYMAMQAIEDIYNRCCYECFADVILVTTAIKNSSHVTGTGRPSEGPMGISVALSSATTTVTTVKKSMITNASFRTKKLPDDLDITLFQNEQSLPSSRRPSGTDQSLTNDLTVTKTSKKGRRKTWSWLHRNSLEDDTTKPKQTYDELQQQFPSSHQSSPEGYKNKHARRFSEETSSKLLSVDDLKLSNSDSPKRRVFSQSKLSSPNRMSAGAKLCKVFENEVFDEDVKGLYISRKPNSLSLLKTTQNL